MRNERVILSTYHQACAEAAVKHLQSPSILTSLPKKLQYEEELLDIWGNQPIFVSTSRHALLEPDSGYFISDRLALTILERTKRPVQVNHLVWESHPVGVGELNIYLARSKETLIRRVPNVTQWGIPHQVAKTILQDLAQGKGLEWEHSLKELLSNFNHFSHQRFHSVCEKLQELSTQALTKGTSLTRFCLNWEYWLVQHMGLPRRGVEISEPSSSSMLNKKVVATLNLLHQKIGLEEVFDRMLDEGQGSLFTGGIGDTSIRVGFSKSNHRFEIVYQDAETGKKRGKPKPLSTDELLQTIEADPDTGLPQLIPTGKALSLGLVLGSTVVPIAYLGNGEKEFARARKGLELDQTPGLLQVTDDYKDRWPLVEVKSDNQPYYPGLTNLFVMQGERVQKLAETALITCRPVQLDQKEYFGV